MHDTILGVGRATSKDQRRKERQGYAPCAEVKASQLVRVHPEKVAAAMSSCHPRSVLLSLQKEPFQVPKLRLIQDHVYVEHVQSLDMG
ncbi:hypothetical protein VNO77_03032 [Canavalia gladiata]|uniref:Uncharacterized protein n=1 Tax=Canavalia gladiata TaxID=3824 RepID=A0AAN9R7S6_CANGL